MEREILFRGKRIDNGEWVEGVPLVTSISGVYMVSSKGQAKNSRNGMVIKDVVVQHELDHETVSQYTGLKDKNGKRIFEGDICLHKEYECFGKIEWSYTEACYYFCVCNGNRVFEEEQLYEYVDGLNIIGNIYDNTELLEVQ